LNLILAQLYGSNLTDGESFLAGLFGPEFVSTAGVVGGLSGPILPGITELGFTLPFQTASSGGAYGGARIGQPETYTEPDEEIPTEQLKVITETLPDGTRERRFPDGTLESIAPDGTITIRKPDGTLSVTTPDGVLRLTAADGTVTVIYPDGRALTTLSNGIRIETFPDGTTLTTLTDGTVITTQPDGTTIKTMPDGTTEVLMSEGLALLEAGYPETVTPQDETSSIPEKADAESTESPIELGSLVAGLSGWGLASTRAHGGSSVLDREGFQRLERERERKKFIRWSDGELVHS
jgi:hypothetical protein